MSNLTKEMKYLYIVDYWIPFPSSEYGGVVDVIAESDQECFDLLKDWRDEYNSNYDNLIMQKIKTAIKLKLDTYSEEQSRIASAFTT